MKPPKITDAFSLDVPDIDKKETDAVMMAVIRDAVLELRKNVLTKGTLASRLMDYLHWMGNPMEITAAFDSMAHPRYLGKNVTCMIRQSSDCLKFEIIKLIKYFQDDNKRCAGQLAKIKQIIKHGFKKYCVAGNVREGFRLKLRK